MNLEPRQKEDYSSREVEAAHRVLIDIGQVLASFTDCLVLIGGWVPDLLLPKAEEAHVGSIDVDLALDAKKLGDGRYADLLKLLLETRRYRPGQKQFQLVVDVDLKDGEKPVQVDLEFLAPKDVKLQKHRPKLIKNFRVLQADGCAAAFRDPISKSLSGQNVQGASNTVHLRIASLPDFLVMKAYAIGGREKPKDSYDFCYCLEHVEDGMESIASEWKKRKGEADITKAIGILKEKFTSVDAFGPQQVVEFGNSANKEERDMQARRAYESVKKFLERIG
jgi:Nucleotidyl transferase AbiEii toxin, Type IV TA system